MPLSCVVPPPPNGARYIDAAAGQGPGTEGECRVDGHAAHERETEWAAVPQGRRDPGTPRECGQGGLRADGFLDARISDIAERAGLSHGSFYHYFESKEEVFREVAAEVDERLRAPLNSVILDPSSSATPYERIREAIRLHLESYRDEARIMGVIEQVSRFDDADPRRALPSATSAYTDAGRGFHSPPAAPRPGRPASRPRHRGRRPRLHDLPVPRDVVRPGPPRLRLRRGRGPADAALRERAAAARARGRGRRPPPARPRAARAEPALSPPPPSVAACHSSSCGASMGQRANSASSGASWRSIHSRSPHGGSTSRAWGSSSASASDVARVWWASLSPLRNTSAGMSSARASASGRPGTCSPSRGQ